MKTKAILTHVVMLATGLILGLSAGRPRDNSEAPILATKAERNREQHLAREPAQHPERLHNVHSVDLMLNRKDTSLLPQKTPDQIAVLQDGRILVPPALANRIVIRAIDESGVVDKDELALIGIDNHGTEELQQAIDGAKQWEIDREAREAEVLSQDATVTLLHIQGAGEDAHSRKKFNDGVSSILGQKLPCIARALLNVDTLTSHWGAADKVITATTLPDGITEFEIVTYELGRPPTVEDDRSIADPANGAFSIRTFRSRGIPERLRHLFQ